MKLSTYSRNLVPALGGLALVFAAACGDGGDSDPQPDANGNGNGTDPDAGGNGTDPDAGGDDPDAGPSAAEREGTVAITETQLVAQGEADPVGRGATTSISFAEPGTGDGTVEDIGACTVTTLESGQAPADTFDEGPITISGTELGEEDGSFSCAYDGDASSYVCSLASDDAATMTLRNCGLLSCDIAGSQVELVLTDDNLATDHNLVGSRVFLEGFDANTAAGGPYLVADQEYNGSDTVLQLPGDTTVPDAPDNETGDGEGVYDFTVGTAAPAPGEFAGNTPVFLVGENTAEDIVDVAKDSSDNIDAFDVSAFPLGQDVTFAGGENPDGEPFLQPYEFLAERHDSPVHFSCADDLAGGDAEQGDCGIEDADLDALDGVYALIVSGVATNADGDAVSFTCPGINSKTVTLSTDVIDAILDIDPNNVQTRVTFANGSVEGSGNGNVTRALVGNTYAGQAEVPAAQ